MTSYSDLSTIVLPLIAHSKAKSVLLVGETARDCYIEQHNTRSQLLTTPFSLQQLAGLGQIDIAIVSEITETLTKEQAMTWLGLLRNKIAQRIILVSQISDPTAQSWLLADYLAMAMKHIATTQEHRVFSYALDSYNFKREWLNDRFWANPENFDKFRW